MIKNKKGKSRTALNSQLNRVIKLTSPRLKKRKTQYKSGRDDISFNEISKMAEEHSIATADASAGWHTQ